MVKRILLGVAMALLLAVVAVWAAYRRDMRRAYARVERGSSVLPSPWGDVEYALGGVGPAVLVIHGSGGGFDQGELMAKAAIGEGFHWIAPSRFGYLRSTLPSGATFDQQARAYAHLLDHLGIEKVAVLALSHGGPSALLFAVLYPDRVSSLTLISAGVASSAEPAQAQANRQGDALKKIFERDLYYWTLTRAARKRFLTIMGASPTVIAGLTPEQRELVDQLIDFMNPVSLRSAGAAFDNQARMPNERIAAIRAPTLILHAGDDTLQLYRHAEYAAAHIPGAKLLSFERGGHLLLAVEQAAILTMVRAHILEHAQGL